ncbi:MAG: YcxB family protein [Clostridia bacterium]|nr:YcxB family protein [Clostridia bacterium]
MKEIFKNETKSSKKEYNMFIEAHDKEFGFREDLHTIICAAVFLCFIIYAFLNSIFIFAFIVSIILIIFILYKILQPNYVVKKELKSNKVRKEYTNKYSFYKYSFIIKNKETNLRIFYFKIYRVLENDTHFYIYITPKRAYVISKSGFTKGNAKDFARFIKKRVFFKYKNRCEGE